MTVNPTRTPAETLKAAADKLEDLLDVGDGPHGLWRVHEEPPYFVVRDGAGYGWLYADSDTESKAAVDYAAAMSPSVGTALVELFRAVTTGIENGSWPGPDKTSPLYRAARAILGEHKEDNGG